MPAYERALFPQPNLSRNPQVAAVGNQQMQGTSQVEKERDTAFPDRFDRKQDGIPTLPSYAQLIAGAERAWLKLPTSCAIPSAVPQMQPENHFFAADGAILSTNFVADKSDKRCGPSTAPGDASPQPPANIPSVSTSLAASTTHNEPHRPEPRYIREAKKPRRRVKPTTGKIVKDVTEVSMPYSTWRGHQRVDKDGVVVPEGQTGVMSRDEFNAERLRDPRSGAFVTAETPGAISSRNYKNLRRRLKNGRKRLN